MKKLCALLLALLMVTPLSGCVMFTAFAGYELAYHALASDEQRYADVLVSNWNISLPEEFEQVFYTSTQHPRGEGPRYCVLRYKNSAVLEDFGPWAAEEGTTNYCDSYYELLEQTVEYLEVPAEYWPDYDQCLRWYWHSTDGDTRDELLMLWDGELLWIIEQFY